MSSKQTLSGRVILLAILIIAVFLACLKIDRPGLYYDELLFVNAATGAKTNIYVSTRIFGIPVLLMKYIGALKSWIYFPIFSLLPVNAWTVRLPAILIGLAGALWLVTALWRSFGPATGIAGAVMILLDPTILMHSRLDWGPNALMFFFRGLVVLALMEWIRTRHHKWIWLAIISMMLGIFDKLNFIWFAYAATGALVLFYKDRLLDFAHTRPRHAALAGGLLSATLITATIRAVHLAVHTDTTWSQRLPYAALLIRMTLCGGGALDFVSHFGLRVEQWFWSGYLPVIAVALFGIRPLLRLPAQRRLNGWLITLFSLVTAAFVLTKTATGTHHSSMLSGIWEMLLAPPIGAFWDNPAARRRLSRHIAAAGALVLAAAGSAASSLISINAFAQPVNLNWDIANTKAAAFTNERPGALFVSADWGIGNILVAKAGDRSAVMDAWPVFTDPKKADTFIKNLPENKDVYIFTRMPEFENFRGNRTILTNVLKKNHISHEIAATYMDWQNVPMIEIWKIRL